MVTVRDSALSAPVYVAKISPSASVVPICVQPWSSKSLFNDSASESMPSSTRYSRFEIVWPLALVGWILIGARYAELSLFDWRIWRYGWLLWLAIIAIYWGLYFTRHYSAQLEYYKQERVKAQYVPPPNPKKRPVRASHR